MHDMQSSPAISLELLRRFDVTGPHYTSYPTADRFVDTFDAQTYHEWLRQRAARPWSLVTILLHAQ